MLVTVMGEEVDKAILNMALRKRPCLLIDCANAADPYSVPLEEEWLDDIYVINAEAIYRFRDALKKTKEIMNGLKVKRLFVTSIAILFSYDDKLEDKHVITECWEILKKLSLEFEVYAVADAYSTQYADEQWDTRLLAKEW